MLAEIGIIVWYDYFPGKNSARDFINYFTEFSKNTKFYNIKDIILVNLKNE